MDYKDTLLMPQTDFQMRGNLPENEKLQRQKWDEMDLYSKVKEKNKGKTPFVLHDGPPYANGNIHIGHAMNKILKDFVNRYKMMSGYDITFIPGWDTHGLPIEQAVTNSGVDRKSMSKSDFRTLCEKYAYEQIAKQDAGFKELNVIADWDNPYITLKKEMEARQVEVFAEMAKKGLIFKGLKPVYWSPSSESALAEAEIEYKDRKDPSIFVAFPVSKGNDKVNVGENLVIWTTTPWTLPGNLGIAVGENFDYAKVEVDGKIYIMANDLVESLALEFNWEDYKIVETIPGTSFEDVEYQHIFMDRTSPVVIGFHVTLDAGTGLVHIAPGYGADDFIIGKQYDLGLINGVNDQGYLTLESGEFEGLFFEDANKAITQKLDELGVLLKLKFIKHSYPHDWRTKKPIIFRATPQWFCSIDKIKDTLLNEIENNIKFHTPWGKKRLYNMIKDRGDWCISRQRVWGVPIPIFYNEDGSEILDYDVMMHVANLFREHGSNIWFEKNAKDLLPEGYTNEASPNGNFTKEEDIMDVWFDSGSTHTGVLVERGLEYPAHMYLEGSDQYRGWFNSSLITGVAVYGKAPYKELVSHGFVLDGQGNKMSKSLGNTVSPADMVRLHGSDILRWWVASTDYTEDIKIGDELIKQVKETYRKIRNTYKFMLGNLKDFNPETDSIKYEDMSLYDKYMMNKLNEFTNDILNAYNEYNFSEVYKLTNNFVSTTLSSFYFDFTKDILYIEAKDSLLRKSVQTVIYNILSNEISLLAPLLPYTSEEVYNLLPGKKELSVHLTDMPEVIEYSDSKELDELFDLFFDFKEVVYKKLEDIRNEKVIGSSLEAEIKVSTNDKYNLLNEKLGDCLHQLLVVSKVIFTENNKEIEVSKSNGEKCDRCWNYVDELHDGICNRCNSVVNK
ncbi:MAG: isoleucine--tRNA ligase [Bacilli bacterium]|nr:isoleucine--tRNA ligase [Bacilli bacterium]